MIYPATPHEGAVPAMTHPSSTEKTKSLYLQNIQYLRGLAALLVVVFHASAIAKGRWGLPFFYLGECGVDVFFVISGLVMAMTARHLSGWSGARSFFVKRIIRVAPLYWLFTLFKVGLFLVAPSVFGSFTLDWGNAIAAFFFIPWNEMYPPLQVGWTLNFEMFFYVAIGLVMIMRLSMLKWTPVVLVLMAAASLVKQPSWPVCLQFWADPIIIEFAFGLFIGAHAQKISTLPTRWAWSVLSICLVLAIWAATVETSAVEWRVLLYGIPAAMIVAACIILEKDFRSKKWQTAGMLGDTSYSLYLSHPFVLPVVALLVSRLPLSRPVAGYLYYVLALLACVAAAYMVHKLIELPLTRYLNSRHRRTNVEPSAAPVASSS